ncbi:hypothetical protein MLD38_006357 [Melastoma candidum]|uniref:Uncharacterized protein n=1 Tax=Melastoma candidum TaxID=119954 RepID=A0ACB9RRC4_9MYRT|nr:hypothetical protein MLD38_006357 [Melastoma candidum]
MGNHPKVDYFVVDAFTDSPFKGNPAAVCFLEEERDEGWLQAVATEFNISQTSYLTKDGSDDAVAGCPRFRLRWFTPVAEVKLCGHATLAAAHVLFTSGRVDSDCIEFLTLSGVLTAKKVPEAHSNGSTLLIELDFPEVLNKECSSEEILTALEVIGDAPILEMRRTAADDLLVVLSSANLVEEFCPRLDKIRKWTGRGVIITAAAAQGSGFDFFSRFFCPNLGINEDPVCGSAHCALTSYWSTKMGKHDFVAYQASPRSGILKLELDTANGRVRIRGKAVIVMQGTIIA